MDGVVVRGLFVFLKERFIFDYMLDELIQRDILNKNDIEDYICNKGKYFRIEKFIKCIIWKKRCSDFVIMINEMFDFENIVEKIWSIKENIFWIVEGKLNCFVFFVCFKVLEFLN